MSASRMSFRTCETSRMTAFGLMLEKTTTRKGPDLIVSIDPESVTFVAGEVCNCHTPWRLRLDLVPALTRPDWHISRHRVKNRCPRSVQRIRCVSPRRIELYDHLDFVGRQRSIRPHIPANSTGWLSDGQNVTVMTSDVAGRQVRTLANQLVTWSRGPDARDVELRGSIITLACCSTRFQSMAV